MDRRESTSYALLIGVDCYLENELSNGGWYPCLGGCVRDINHVEKFLRTRLGLTDQQILKLTATYEGPLPPRKRHRYQPIEPKSQWPTYENMIDKFKGITRQANPGDQVYIHYSGHGGRAISAFPNLKGTDGFDESLVPADIGKPDGRYLRDVEIAYLLQTMVEKGLVVTVVLDSCHSGGATRGRGGAVARRAIGTGGAGMSVDTVTPPQDSLVASIAELSASWRGLSIDDTRALKPASGWLLEPQGYTLLAACRASESAYEYPFNGLEYSGALTYWMLDSLRQIGPGMTYKTLHDRILAKIHSQFVMQTPQLQGIGDRAVFGSDRVQPVYNVSVMKVENLRVQIEAGQAHGLRKGANFAIYPVGTVDFTQTDQRLALVEITELGAVRSWASITDRLQEKAIEQGAQAVFLDPGDVKLQRAVFLGMASKRIAERLKQAVVKDGGNFLRVAMNGEPAELQVTTNAFNEYEIWDSAGEIIPNLRPPFQVDALDSIDQLVRRLVHLAKYRNVHELDNRDPMSPMANALSVELMGVQKEYDPVNGPQPQPFADPGSTPMLQEGEWTFLRIRNRLRPNPDDPNDPARILNVTVLDLESNWRITQIYPYEAGYFEPLDPGGEIVLPLQAELPAGCETGIDVVKVFATQGTTNFRWLELPALDKPIERKSYRCGSPGALDQLLKAVVEDGPLAGTQRLKVYESPSRSWTTSQVEVSVTKAKNS